MSVIKITNRNNIRESFRIGLPEEASSDGDKKFNYMLLSRLISDCKYYLGNGNRNDKDLWAGNVKDQIAKMKTLYNSFPEGEKLQWTSMKEIENFEKKMQPFNNKLANKKDHLDDNYIISAAILRNNESKNLSKEQLLQEVAKKLKREPLTLNKVTNLLNKAVNKKDNNIKVESVVKKPKSLLEGAGAGYTITTSEIEIISVDTFNISNKKDLGDNSYLVDIDASIKCKGLVQSESYEGYGKVNSAAIIISKINAMFDSTPNIDIHNDDEIKSYILDDIKSMFIKSNQGGGWFHQKFTGKLVKDGEKDINGTYNIISLDAIMTDEDQITFIDRAADNGNSFIQYSILDTNNEVIDVTEDEEEAIKKAKELNAERVDAITLYTSEYGNDVEDLDDATTIWQKGE